MLLKKIKVISFILVGVFLSVSHAATYSYTGPHFTESFGSYSNADRIVGTFTTADALPDNMARTDISGLLQSYEFNDGQQTLTNNNSTIIVFSVSTDSRGNPDTWSIAVWLSPVTTTFGDSVQGIDTTFNPGQNGLAQDAGIQDGICGDLGGPGGQCSSTTSTSTNSGNFFQFEPSSAPGTWLGGRPRVIPSLGVYALLTLITMTLLLAFFVFNKKQKSFIKH